MKRILILGALASLVAVPSAAARSAGTLYSGALRGVPDSEALLKVLQRDGEPVVSRFAAKSFDVTCDDGTVVHLRRAALKGTVEIGNRGGFVEKNDNGATVFKLRGKLDGSRAEGSFHYFGEIADANGVTRDCDSGRLEWKARS